MITVGVKILPRQEVLDSQGRTVEKTLVQHGKKVEHCRVGKYIELEIDTVDEQQALKQAREVTEFVLYNPLIESYQLEVIS